MARECLGIACFLRLVFLHLLFNLWSIALYWFLVISFAQPFTSVSGKQYYITISVTQQSLPIPALTSSVKWTQVMRVSSLVRCFYQKVPQCHATSIPGKIVLLGKKWVRKSEISRGNVRFKDLYFLFLVFFSEILFNLIKPMLLHWYHCLHCVTGQDLVTLCELKLPWDIYTDALWEDTSHRGQRVHFSLLFRVSTSNAHSTVN